MSEINKLKSLSNDELLKLISTTNSKQDLLRSLDINIKNSQATKYLIKFIKTNNVDISHYTMGHPLRLRFDKEVVQKFANDSICWSDLMKLLNIKFVGNNINTVKKLVKYYNIDISHFDAKLAARNNHSALKTEDEILCENSMVVRGTLKRHVIQNKLIEYKCNGKNCTITDSWLDNPIILHIEHKNGIGNDNRLENLCFLCPNCHSQTSTFAGRNVLGSKRRKDGSFDHA